MSVFVCVCAYMYQSSVVLESASLDLASPFNNGACLKLVGGVKKCEQQPLSTKPSLLR